MVRCLCRRQVSVSATNGADETWYNTRHEDVGIVIGCVGLCDCAQATGGDGGVWIELGVTNEVNGTEMNANEMVSCGGAGRAALPSAMPSPVSRLASSEPNMANA